MLAIEIAAGVAGGLVIAALIRAYARDVNQRLRYACYRAAVLQNGWFDPVINPRADSLASQAP